MDNESRPESTGGILRDPEKLLRIVFWLLLALILIFKALLIINYNSRYVDDDQALMWNATAAYAHFQFPEPFFWGQNYGFMLESILAVPLYWLRVPMWIAMPVATTVCSLFAFVYVGLMLKKDRHPLAACLVLAFYLILSWKWDTLTTIPRCFISGMSVTVAGAVMMDRSTNQHTKAFFGSLLCVLGVVMTNNAAVIGGIGFLKLLLDIRKKYKLLPAVAGGALLGILVYLLAKNFYVINREYSLHTAIQPNFSLDVLRGNISRIPKLLGDFAPSGIGWISLILLAGFALYLLLSKNLKTFLLLFAGAAVTVLLLSMGKINDYSDASVTFSQTRMFLYLPYALLLILYFFAEDRKVSPAEEKLRRFVRTKAVPAALIIPALCLALNVVKITDVVHIMQTPDNPLLYGYVTFIFPTDRVVSLCGEIRAKAEECGADMVVMNDRRMLAYAFDALYYGDYTVYNGTYDRRTWNYTELLQKKNHRCLLVTSGIGADPTCAVIDFTEEESPIEYFEGMGMRRRP